MRAVVQRLQRFVQGGERFGRFHLGDVNGTLFALRLLTFARQPRFPRSTTLSTTQRKRFPQWLEVRIRFL